MLVSRQALGVVLDGLDGLCRRCAELARAHRTTVMAGRTLLQQAVPVTFGLKCAGWLTALVEARARLDPAPAGSAWPSSSGGRPAPSPSLGPAGPAVVAGVAAELGLAEPPMPWHTNRVRMAEIACALGVALGVAGKVATDVVLLAQTEVGEVDEGAGPGRGGSSTMPHKHNPVGRRRGQRLRGPGPAAGGRHAPVDDPGARAGRRGAGRRNGRR